MAGYNPSTDSKWKVWLPVYGIGTYETMIGGCFLPQGTSAPKQATVTSTGANGIIGQEWWAVSRLGVGRFLVTLQGGWPTGAFSTQKIKGIRCSLQLASIADTGVTIGPVNVALGNIEIDARTLSTGAAVDISANASNAIFWHLRMSLGTPGAIQNT